MTPDEFRATSYWRTEMPRTAIAVCSLFAVLASAGSPRAQGTLGLEPPPDLAAPPPDAERTPSGLATRLLEPGEGGMTPMPTDYVTLHFAGWTTDGNLIDSSGSSAPMFPLDRTLPGFRECVTMMSIGEQRRCWMPESLGYQGQPGRPAGPLVFDVQLLEARRPPSMPPEDVGEPPADAERTESGLAFRRLRPGTGTRNPSEFSQVRVHYTGWTIDGGLIDTSLTLGLPVTQRVSDFIPGWIEGLQSMVEGERLRLWVPEELAYMGEEGGPAGMLVFDIELVAIDN